MGDISLDAYLDASGYGTAFRDDHLYPMAAAIWSTPAAEIGEYPARAFVRFCENHGLLKLVNRPLWRTLTGGSRAYVEKLAESDPRDPHERAHFGRPATFGRRGDRFSRRRGPAFRSDRPGDTRRSGARDAGRPNPRGGTAAWRFWLLREQRRAPFRRNSDAAADAASGPAGIICRAIVGTAGGCPSATG